MTNQPSLTFLTCGHVDDGKSTLIGRLLHDLGAVPQDQEHAATSNGQLDLALLTDGLEDERRQGITIDVAYRFFTHEGRRFRIADTPGHLEYTRNMAVAAVEADVALIVVDATHGVREQTLRHSQIATLLGVRQFIIVINKMDAVDYDEATFTAIQQAYQAQADQLLPADATLQFIPVSALKGQGVIKRGDALPWYQGPSVLEALQSAQVRPQPANQLAFPVQHVLKNPTPANANKRWYYGTVTGDVLKVGDQVFNTNGEPADVDAVYHGFADAEIATPGSAIAVGLDREVDITRGDVLTHQPATLNDSAFAEVIWLNNDRPTEGFQGILKTHHMETQVHLVWQKWQQEKNWNSPNKPAFITLAQPLALEIFQENPRLGLFLLIDAGTERVVAVGVINKLPNEGEGRARSQAAGI